MKFLESLVLKILIICLCSSCNYNNEQLTEQWYLRSVINLDTNEDVFQNDCQYLFLNADNTFESKGFIRQKGRWEISSEKIVFTYSTGKKENIEIESVSNTELRTVIDTGKNRLQFIYSTEVPEVCL